MVNLSTPSLCLQLFLVKFSSRFMAATRSTLLLLFTSILLFTLYFTPLCHHNLNRNPSSISQAFNNLIEALTVFKFNQNEHYYEDTNLVLLTETTTDNETNPKRIPEVDDGWPLLHEKEVVALTEKNFSDFMAENKYVMVLFYVPWCYWTKKLAPEYGAAAKMLQNEAVLAMVDCTVEVELGRKNRINGYPTMYFFVGGVRQNLYDFELERTSDAITTWVKRKMALDIHNITTMDEAIHTLNAESELVLGFLDSLEGPESEELAAASNVLSDVNFYQTARADVAELFHIDPKVKRPALIFLQTVSKKFSIQYHGKFTRLAIAEFVSKIKHPLVVTFTVENAGPIFENPMKQLWLFARKYDSKKVISTFEEAAVAFREKLLFVYVEMDTRGVGNQIVHEFGITGDAPTVIAYEGHGAKKHELNGELSLSSIKSFAKDFLEDKLSSHSYPTTESVLKLPSQSLASFQLHFHM